MKFASSINTKMKNLFQVISYEIKSRNLLNCSVLGLEDIYNALIPFRKAWHTNHHKKPLYFASLDLQGCFDNINQEKLLSTMKSVFSTDEYLLRRYIQILTSHGIIRAQYIKQANSISEFTPFYEFCVSNFDTPKVRLLRIKQFEKYLF